MNIQLIALFVAPFTSICALGYGLYLAKRVLSAPEGNEKLKQIAKAVREGAMSYLKRQFKVVIPIMLLLAFVMLLSNSFILISSYV